MAGSKGCLGLAASSFVAALLTVNAADAQVGISISGEVKAVCRVSLQSTHPDSQNHSAQLREFCNVSNGYDVFVDYPPSATGKSLLIDGQAVELVAGGSVRVASSNRPARVTRTVAWADGSSSAEQDLQFRIVHR
jgi:hypothetical protein